MNELDLYKNPALHAVDGACYVNAANYPGMLYFVHADDQTANLGTDVISFRIAPGGITGMPTRAGIGGLQRDANGIFTATTVADSLAPIGGTVPDAPAGKHLLCCTVGLAPNASPYRANYVIGQNTTPGDGFNSSGAWYMAGTPTGICTAPAMSPALAAGDASKTFCQATLFRTSGTPDERVGFHNNSGTSFAVVTGTTTSNNCSLMPGHVLSNIISLYSCHSANAGGSLAARTKMAFVMALSNNLTDEVLISAIRWMAINPGLIYPGLPRS